MAKVAVDNKSRIQKNKDRLKAVKPVLRLMGFRTVIRTIANKYPELNTLEGGVLISNVWYRNVADSKVVDILEKIAKGKIKA